MYDTVKIVKTRVNPARLFLNGMKVIRDRNGNILTAFRKIILPRYYRPKEILVNYSYSMNSSLSLSFSLPVIVHGTNLHEFDPVNDKEYLLETLNTFITSVINSRVQTFRVSRLDLCKNIELDIPSDQLVNSMALNSLQSVKSKGKHIYSNGISFNNNTETFHIYDKIVNDQEKEYQIPNEFENRNIIRIENQIKSYKGIINQSRYGRELKFNDIFKPKNIKKSKELLLKGFHDYFGECIIKNDIITLSREIKNRLGKKDLLDSVIKVIAFQKELIHIDEIHRVLKCFYSDRQVKRGIRQYQNIDKLSNNLLGELGRFSLYEKLKKELGVK